MCRSECTSWRFEYEQDSSLFLPTERNVCVAIADDIFPACPRSPGEASLGSRSVLTIHDRIPPHSTQTILNTCSPSSKHQGGESRSTNPGISWERKIFSMCSETLREVPQALQHVGRVAIVGVYDQRLASPPKCCHILLIPSHSSSPYPYRVSCRLLQYSQDKSQEYLGHLREVNACEYFCLS